MLGSKNDAIAANIIHRRYNTAITAKIATIIFINYYSVTLYFYREKLASSLLALLRVSSSFKIRYHLCLYIFLDSRSLIQLQMCRVSILDKGILSPLAVVQIGSFDPEVPSTSGFLTEKDALSDFSSGASFIVSESSKSQS